MTKIGARGVQLDGLGVATPKLKTPSLLSLALQYLIRFYSKLFWLFFNKFFPLMSLHLQKILKCNIDVRLCIL